MNTAATVDIESLTQTGVVAFTIAFAIALSIAFVVPFVAPFIAAFVVAPLVAYETTFAVAALNAIVVDLLFTEALLLVSVCAVD